MIGTTTSVEAPPPPERKIKLRSLADDILLPDEPIEWVWSDRHMVAPGRPTILGAYGGAGKTWLALTMAMSVATGIPFLGQKPVKTGKVVILEYETGRRRLVRRLRRIVAGHGIGDDLSNVQFAAQEDLTTYLTSPGAEDELLALCAGATLLIVDSLIQGSQGLRENDAEMAGPLYLLARVSAATGCAIVVIHHERKTMQDAAGGAGQSLRGHSSLQAACDAIWRLAPVETGKIEMRATKCSDGPTPTGWDLEIVDTEGGGIIIGHTDAAAPSRAAKAAPVDHEAQLLAIIVANPALGVRDLRGLARPMRNPDFDDAIARLVAAGAVERRSGRRGAITHHAVEVGA